jgi:hypothetical protein
MKGESAREPDYALAAKTLREAVIAERTDKPDSELNV